MTHRRGHMPGPPSSPPRLALQRRLGGLLAPIVLPPAPPGATRVIDIAAQRWDGGSGTIMTSNAVPLIPGDLTAAGLSQVRLYVNGVEQSIGILPLQGFHADGSYRSLLVQTDLPLLNAAPVPGQLVFGGGVPNMPRLAMRATQAVPNASILPTDTDYLIATKLGGPLYDPSKVTAPIQKMTQYETDYPVIEAYDFNGAAPAHGPGWDTRSANYDRPFIEIQAWLRTGDPTYWRHAMVTENDYLTRYIVPNAGVNPWHWMFDGIAAHYLLTGDERSRYQLRKLVEYAGWYTRGPAYGGGRYILSGRNDLRIMAKTITGLMALRRLNIETQPADAASYYGTTGNAIHATPTSLETAITDTLAVQQANGSWGGTQFNYAQINFQAGLLTRALAWYYDEWVQDSRIPPAIKAQLDYAWANEYVPASFAFKYASWDATDTLDNITVGTATHPQLNPMTATAYAWYDRRFGSAVDRARFDTIITDSYASSTENSLRHDSGKAFDEAYQYTWNGFAYRMGIG